MLTLKYWPSPHLQFMRTLKQAFVLPASTMSTEDFWRSVSVTWVLGHLPDQRPSCPVPQCGCMANSRKCLGGSRLVPFHNYREHCALGITQSFRNGFIPLPWSIPQHKMFLWMSAETFLIPVLICCVNSGTLRYIHSLHTLKKHERKQDAPDHNLECSSSCFPLSLWVIL